MPLFFLISGYLLKFKENTAKYSYKSFIISKAKRLLLPYAFWNLLFLIPKILLDIPNSTQTVAKALKALVYPRQNICGYTWFLFALFLAYAVSPVVKAILDKRSVVIKTAAVAACVIFYVLHIGSELFALSDLHKDFLFFVLGYLLGGVPQKQLLPLLKKSLIPAAVVATVTYLPIHHYGIYRLNFIPCAAVLLTLISLGAFITKMPPLLERVALNSFGIYIMHWPVMLAVRTVLHQILGIGCGITATVMVICGYIIPTAILALIHRLPLKRLKKPLKYLLGA